MEGIVHKVYSALPPGCRNLAASARGWRLRQVRYGPETERLVAEAIEREQWDSERWREWQQERVSHLLPRAINHVPHYRKLFFAVAGRQASAPGLEAWPILEKESLRTQPTGFLADDVQRGRLVHDHTSGTSGKPLDLWFSRSAVREWYALFEARCRRWYGVSRHDRWGIFGGQLVIPVRQAEPPYWVWNVAMKQLYLSSYHLSPATIPHYVEAIRRYRLTYLLGYTSALHSLAQGVLMVGRMDLGLKVVITNAEPLYAYQRETISQAFGCPVRETYGLAETVVAASECEAGRLHLWPEAGVLEVLDSDNQPVAAGLPGAAVATGLLNADMPLIRYRLGDRLTLAPAESRCACGRRLPLVERIEGRSDDVLLTRDGREVGRLDPVFKASLALHEAQIIQESLDRIRVLYVAGPGFSAADGTSIRNRLRDRLGDIEVVLERVQEIRRERNGKFRAVIRRFPHPHTKRERQLAESGVVS